VNKYVQIEQDLAHQVFLQSKGKINLEKLFIEVADTPLKREYGLMDRKTLANNHGMLFKFPQSQKLGFWMRDTYIPLDIAFIDDNGRISQIERMYPLSTRSIRSNKECKYALEVNAGWFKDNDIGVGDKICETSLKTRKLYSQVVKKKKEKKEEPKKLDIQKSSPDVTEELGDENVEENTIDTPEMDVEGEYPKSIYAVPYEEGEKPEIDYIRDLRGKIHFANDNNLEMEILYWTMRGHMLPPRRVKPMDKDGYVVKKGKTGELLVAFDTSPSLSGSGWTIKGGQPKSFLLDNIVQLQVIGKDGNQLTDAQIETIRNPQPQQQPQSQQKPKGFLDKIKNIFTR
jgi:uncharacterized membrane protein (UPF0127 family)